MRLYTQCSPFVPDGKLNFCKTLSSLRWNSIPPIKKAVRFNLLSADAGVEEAISLLFDIIREFLNIMIRRLKVKSLPKVCGLEHQDIPSYE